MSSFSFHFYPSFISCKTIWPLCICHCDSKLTSNRVENTHRNPTMFLFLSTHIFHVLNLYFPRQWFFAGKFFFFFEYTILGAHICISYVRKGKARSKLLAQDGDWCCVCRRDLLFLLFFPNFCSKPHIMLQISNEVLHIPGFSAHIKVDVFYTKFHFREWKNQLTVTLIQNRDQQFIFDNYILLG